MNQKIEIHGEVHRPSNPNANTVWLGVVGKDSDAIIMQDFIHMCVNPYASDVEKSGQNKTEPHSRNSQLHYGNDAQGPMPQEVSDL